MCGGAIPNVLKNGDKYTKIEKLAQMAGKAVNARFVTIDIFECDNEFLVLEINSAVSSSNFMQKAENGRELMKNVYGLAIKKMFE